MYIFIIIFTLCIIIHYHFYRWGLFTIRLNVPQIYRSEGKGILIFYLIKIALFIYVIFKFGFYELIFIFLFFQILKYISFRLSLLYYTKYFFAMDIEKEKGEISKEQLKTIRKKARDSAENMMLSYKYKLYPGSGINHIFFLLT